jgi:hypothetical protein
VTADPLPPARCSVAPPPVPWRHIASTLFPCSPNAISATDSFRRYATCRPAGTRRPLRQRPARPRGGPGRAGGNPGAPKPRPGQHDPRPVALGRCSGAPGHGVRPAGDDASTRSCSPAPPPVCRYILSGRPGLCDGGGPRPTMRPRSRGALLTHRAAASRTLREYRWTATEKSRGWSWPAPRDQRGA